MRTAKVAKYWRPELVVGLSARLRFTLEVGPCQAPKYDAGRTPLTVQQNGPPNHYLIGLILLCLIFSNCFFRFRATIHFLT